MGLVVLLLIALLVLVFTAFRRDKRLTSGAAQEAAGGEAAELLALRFARGEIDAESYKAMKKVLEGRD
jgi:uncharacterized membrane protein